MKKAYFRAIVIGSILLTVAPMLLAEPSGQINYQARLLDAYGRRVNGNVALTFKFYDALTDGTLLWSESHASVAVSDGIYSINLGATTPIPASVFTQDGVYLELAINSETMSPRQLITYAGQALVARTIMGEDIYVNQSNGKVGIGTTTPTEKLDVAGAIKVTGFKMPTGATANYFLMTDGDGTAQWQPVSSGIMETDPVFNAWSVNTYAPATGNLWAAVGDLDAATGTLNGAVANLNAATGTLNGAVANLNAATGTLNGAVANLNAATQSLDSTKLNISGGVMTGPLTNEVAYYGNGVGLTNIPAGGMTLTNYVKKTGDSMSGALEIGSYLGVVPGAQTIADNATTVQVVQTYAQIGTSDGALKDFSDCALQIAEGAPGQLLIIQATNGWVRLNNGQGVKLADNVSFSMSTNDTIQLIYDGANWIEINRADNNEVGS